MALAINRGNQFTPTTLADCSPVACAVCGGLECLCRPRFFAGQLLTDEDLKRLDHYITEKNKLHNRYLVGWGVACGLEVVCNSCDGTVTVRSGYALSPCGEDIVVCSDTPVDVCSMIQKCKKLQPRDCQPFQPGANDPCSDTTEDWVLSICYDEKLSRGVVPLKNTGGAACCSRCACGGSGACGCGGRSSSGGCSCGGTSTGNSYTSQSSGCSCGTSSHIQQSTSAQTQCQPTIVCESFRFEVAKVKNKVSDTKQLGAIVQRFWCCLLKLGELFAKFPTSNNQQDVQNWCCAIRDNLLEFTADNPGYDCGLAQRIANMCQANDPQQIGNDVGQLILEYFQYCFCSALLPPCPAAATDDCVPLATITVSRKNGNCNITRVCNIDARKFLVDMPNLGYWLSWIPFGSGLRNLFSSLCCKPFPWEKTSFQAADRSIGFESARAAGRVDAVSAPQPAADFASLIVDSISNRERKVDMQALTMAALGMSDQKGAHNLTDLELRYPFESLLLNQVGRPLVQSYLSGLGGIGTVAGSRFGAATTVASGQQPAAPSSQPGAPPDTQAQIQALKTQLDAMRADLKSSQDQIDKLSKGKKT
jgi:hypothetical protein